MTKWMCWVSDRWHYVVEEKVTGVCPQHGRVWGDKEVREKSRG